MLGSRYVAGGGVEDWDLLRRVLSRGGCRYARTVLGVGVRDLTGGFKCFRAETLRAIDFETVRSEGYAFQVELTYRALARGLRVEEVPITFRDRSAGDSKMSARIALEAIWLVPALRLARRRDGLPEAPGSGEPGTLPIPRHEDRTARGRPGVGGHAPIAAALERGPRVRAARRGRSRASPSPCCCSPRPG